MLIPVHHSPRTPKRLLHSLETYQCSQMPWAVDWTGEPGPNGSDSSKDADVGWLFCAPPALLELKEKGNPLVMDIRCSILHYFRTLHSLAHIVCKSFMADKTAVSVSSLWTPSCWLNRGGGTERQFDNWQTQVQPWDIKETLKIYIYRNINWTSPFLRAHEIYRGPHGSQKLKSSVLLFITNCTILNKCVHKWIYQSTDE